MRLFSLHLTIHVSKYYFTIDSSGLRWHGFGPVDQRNGHTKLWSFGLFDFSITDDEKYYAEVDEVLKKLFGSKSSGEESAGIRVLRVDGTPVSNSNLFYDDEEETIRSKDELN